MPAVHPADITLEELARVLNVWLEHDLVATTTTALTHWAQHTAARSPRLPRPDAALPLLLRLRLALLTRRENLRACEQLLAQDRTVSYGIDRYSPALALCVFEHLLTLRSYSGPLFSVLAYAQISKQKLTVLWKEVPRKDRENKGWLWLQQLGLMVHDGSSVSFNPALLAYAVELPHEKRRMSQTELDELLEVRRIRSAFAEDYIVELEKKRLIAAGVSYLADDVVRISVNDVSAGYDVFSFEIDGRPRHIEVKSSAGPRQFFVLTRNEFLTAKRNSGSYWLAWVGNAARLPSGNCDVAWFHDPIAVLEGALSPWQIEDGDLFIRSVGIDSEYQTPPY